MQHPFRILGLLLCIAIAFSSRAEPTRPEMEATDIYDLRYGETIFYFFQQKYFSAITELMVADVRDPIKIQGEDPKLLLGGLYLAYGMHNEASRIFQELLNDQTLPQTHDRAWYYIAKLRYLKGFVPEAEQALLQIKDTLPPDREAERQHLLANVYLSQKNYPKAIEILKNFSGDSEWEAYAKFNLGVALVKAGELDEGTQLLNEVGSLDPFSISHELNALRDKANLALGFAYMRGKNPVEAQDNFQRIRLEGPLSNKALLGLGWSFAQQDKYTEALNAWLELQTRKALDTTVQESLIAIPFTVEKMNKPRLAMQYYQRAIETYTAEINQLENVMLAVQRGELIQAMRPANLEDEASLPINSFGLPKSVSAPYLNQMMATNIFQEAYKNYQSLLHLKHILEKWRDQFPSYEMILNERRKAYYTKLPQVASDARLKEITHMYEKREDIAKEVKRIEDENDGFALANEDEEDLIDTLKSAKTRLDRLGKSEDMSEEMEKYQILHGVLYFQLQSEFIPRLWSVKSNLRELDRALEKTRDTKRSLVKAANEAPKFFEGYDQKIDWSKKRITNLLSRLASAISQQEAHIQNLAMDGLIKRRQALENYHVRARFGIARLYDTLIIEKDKKEQVGGGEAPAEAGPAALGAAAIPPGTATTPAPGAAPASFAEPKAEGLAPAASPSVSQTAPLPSVAMPAAVAVPRLEETLPTETKENLPETTPTPAATTESPVSIPQAAEQPATAVPEPETAPAAAMSAPEPEAAPPPAPETPEAPSGPMPMPANEPGSDIPEAVLNAR